MPETPDFERIARAVAKPFADAYDEGPDDGQGAGNLVGVSPDEDDLTAAIAEQLRLIWNARGAADISQLESILSGLMGVTAAGPYVKNLDRALRTLDR